MSMMSSLFFVQQQQLTKPSFTHSHRECIYGDLTGLWKAMVKQKYGDKQFKARRRGYAVKPPRTSSHQASHQSNLAITWDTKSIQKMYDIPARIDSFQWEYNQRPIDASVWDSSGSNIWLGDSKWTTHHIRSQLQMRQAARRRHRKRPIGGS